MRTPHPIALSVVLVIACARTEPGGSGGSSTTTTTSGAGETTSQPMTTTTTSGATSSTATTGDAVSTSTTPGGLTTGEESTAATTTTSGDADSTTTTTSGGEGTTTSTSTTGSDPFEECIDALGPTYLCGECACEHCTAEIDACEADMGCHEIWKCVRETGCGPTNADCLGPCGDIFFQYGGLFAPSAMLVSAIGMCVDNQCAGQC